MTEKEFALKMQKIKKEYYKRLVNSVSKALAERGFKPFVFDDREGLYRKLVEILPNGGRVGIPGSVTVRELGIMKFLEDNGFKVIEHTFKTFSSVEERMRYLKEEELNVDSVITGCNAITYDGILVNIDGLGNRVAAMAFGIGPIVYIAGVNKIVPDVEAAIKRIRDIATPLNCMRLNIDLPCVKVGYCIECGSNDCICRCTLITELPQKNRDVYVFLITEHLGF